MRLLFDHQIFTLQRYGGISRFFYELISDLTNSDQVDISLFMGHFINEFGLEKYKNRYKKYTGKKHKDYLKSKLFYLHFNNFLFRGFYKDIYPDIYHQTYYQYLNKNYKGKRVITVYDMTHELFPKLFSPLDKTSKWKRISIPKADGITCISKSTKKDLLRMFDISHENVEVVYLGFACVEEFETKRKIDSPYILFVGDRSGHKNFDLLLKSFNIKSNLRKNFKLICFGRDDFLKKELEKIKAYDLEDKVEYITGPDTLLANLYYNASVFVYPSKYEGFGIPPLEAMNYGCPVVASNSSSIPEVVGDAGLYFNPENAEELGEKINEVVDNDVLRSELIKKGLMQKDKFSWKRCSDETLKFYEKVLKS